MKGDRVVRTARRVRRALWALAIAGAATAVSSDRAHAQVGTWEMESDRPGFGGQLRILSGGRLEIGMLGGTLQPLSQPPFASAPPGSWYAVTLWSTRYFVRIDQSGAISLHDVGGSLVSGSRSGGLASAPTSAPPEPSPTAGGAASANNPLGVEWAGSGGATSSPMDASRPGSPVRPTPAPTGSNPSPLGVEWVTSGGSSATPQEPRPPAPPAPPPSGDNPLGVAWVTGGGRTTAPPAPPGPTTPEPPAPGTGPGAGGGTPPIQDPRPQEPPAPACPPRPHPLMPPAPVRFYTTAEQAAFAYGFTEGWRASADRIAPTATFGPGRAAEQAAYIRGLSEGNRAWEDWKRANLLPCHTATTQPLPPEPTQPDPARPAAPVVAPERATVWAWGANKSWQLGAPGDEQLTPIPISDRPVRAIAAGQGHSLMLDTEGHVWAWGMNDVGQLGDPALPTGAGARSATPVRVAGLSDVIAIAAGADHNLALRRDGTVWAWGSNSVGPNRRKPAIGCMLGHCDMDFDATARRVNGISDVTAIAAGFTHSVALRRDGTIWVWGDNEYSQLGDGSPEMASYDTGYRRGTPGMLSQLRDVTLIAASGYNTLAARRDRTIWTWGIETSRGYPPRPIQVGVETWKPYQVAPSPLDPTAIALGWRFGASLRSDGTVLSWGSANTGHGLHVQHGFPQPVRTRNEATNSHPELRDIVAISASVSHGLALGRDGTVWTWGKLTESSPLLYHAERVPGLSNVRAIAAGGSHSLAITGPR
ncbi:MAG TPA: hypothetical protein VGE02_09420 [Gemmatimonadales bacterium]